MAKAVAPQTTSKPVIKIQFPLQRKAYRVRARVTAIVAAMATGTMGYYELLTTAEQQKLMI